MSHHRALPDVLAAASPAALARVAGWAAAAAALAAVFASYFRPSFALDLASRLWSCL